MMSGMRPHYYATSDNLFRLERKAARAVCEALAELGRPDDCRDCGDELQPSLAVDGRCGDCHAEVWGVRS